MAAINETSRTAGPCLRPKDVDEEDEEDKDELLELMVEGVEDDVEARSKGRQRLDVRMTIAPRWVRNLIPVLHQRK